MATCVAVLLEIMAGKEFDGKAKTGILVGLNFEDLELLGISTTPVSVIIGFKFGKFFDNHQYLFPHQ